jgi:hypothetical protein
MKKAIEKTGEMDFPPVPQRYIEIAYLSTQPFKRLWVLLLLWVSQDPNKPWQGLNDPVKFTLFLHQIWLPDSSNNLIMKGPTDGLTIGGTSYPGVVGYPLYKAAGVRWKI